MTVERKTAFITGAGKGIGYGIAKTLAEEGYDQMCIRDRSVIQKKYPGINMEYTVVASEDYLKKIQTTVASGSELPDIVNADGFWRGKLYNMGILERLDAEPYNFDRSTVFDYAVPYMVTCLLYTSFLEKALTEIREKTK